jgi:hypothetical protein
MRCRLDRLRPQGRPPNQLRQSNDFRRFAYAILEILPEGYAQLPAGLLQADKGVAAAPAQLASRAGADLPLFRPLANTPIGFREFGGHKVSGQ